MKIHKVNQHGNINEKYVYKVVVTIHTKKERNKYTRAFDYSLSICDRSNRF